MKDRLERLGETTWKSLRAIARELLARKPGGHLLEADLPSLDLHLEIALREEEGAGPRFSRNLVTAIDRILDDAVEQAAAFRPGHAYCHRCAGAACEHSQPPSCRQVFAGYTQTGTPRWLDFGQLCLEIGHPEVDRLYEQPPAFLTLTDERAELHGVILDAFKNRSYDLLGQVTAGFFPVPARAEEGRGVVALTFQAARSRSTRGVGRLGLNVIGRTPSGDDLAMLWERQRELPWRKAVSWAQSALLGLPRGRSFRRAATRENSAPIDRRVTGILQGLARRLERDQRSRSRRTGHAEQHHESGGRPTREAVADARGAGADALYVDERSGAVVVLGERGRTHFFSPEGRLVSSVRYSRDAIARKLQTEIWLPAPAEVRRAFRDKIAN